MPSPSHAGPARAGSPIAKPARLLTTGAMLLCALAAHAQTAPRPIDGPSFMPMVVALVFVLGLMGAAVWVLRRAGLAPRAGSSHLKIVSQLALGPRERVVVVEAGDRWLLLGVGAGGISRLGTMPKTEAAPADAPPPNFGALLGKLRGAK
jgi:flagellar protein FliO/FliZ